MGTEEEEEDEEEEKEEEMEEEEEEPCPPVLPLVVAEDEGTPPLVGKVGMGTASASKSEPTSNREV